MSTKIRSIQREFIEIKQEWKIVTLSWVFSQKILDDFLCLCYIMVREMEEVFFLCSKINIRYHFDIYGRKTKLNLSGGGSCAHKNHIGMYGM